MNRRRRLAAITATAIFAITAGGCGSVTSQARPAATPPRPPGLATSMVTPGATWAVVLLGGPVARHDNFWQLFVRPAKATTWRLVTPPAVATNGGLVLAGLGGPSVIAGFRPSQGLAFSPLAMTSDNGASWSPAILDGSLANVPDALAATPDGGHLAALLSTGEIVQAGRGATAWSRLTSVRTAAAVPAVRRCGLTGLTAVSFSPSGVPLLAGSCARPGVAGIFSYSAGRWQPAAPALPAALAGRRIQVLRLTCTAAGEVALLAARSGGSADLLAAWTSDAAHWSLSAPVSLGAAGTVRSSGFTASGAAWLLLTGGSAMTIAGSGAAWRSLPRPPSQTAALAFGQAGGMDALAAHGSTLTDWRLAAGSAGWQPAQTIRVPIAYGSSG